MSQISTSAKENLINGFFRQFPGDAASVLNGFSTEEIIDYLKRQDQNVSKQVFARLNPDIATEVIDLMDNQLFVHIFSNIDAYLGARLLSRLDKQTAEAKTALLSPALAREIKELMSYPLDSAGHLMNPMTTTFHPGNTVEEVLKRLRVLGDRQIANIYVIDDEGTFLGVAALQRIAISEPNVKLKDILQAPLGVINALAPVEDVVELLEEKRIIHLPVIDINNKLLGVIRNGDLVAASKEEATEDLQAMFGAGREERALSKVSLAVKNRLPWLHINLLTAFMASLVVGFFEDTIARITVLAVFLPVVAGQSGNTGSQALAVTMRGLALREIRIAQWFKVARKEIMVGLINGLAVALTTSVIVYFWASSFGLSVVIGISMVVSMVIAGFSGAVIPIILKSLGQDPATSSSIVLTTVTDIFGFLSFLGLATLLADVLNIVG
ncbi:magnesium transporter [Cyclobacterium plantarum]|uniref:Magnesium transporter MgtE n=1 Tax=Cyclobacterium plantarum TaxID=2716263 RepID=A0ABX0H704_9BACT|nr:magnesium transporter [Cyclobacterium plantarum]NHE56678.1 magnesium transporter [Cyclobacterium plantarum]